MSKSVEPGGDVDFESIAAHGTRVLWIVSSGGHLVQATYLERLVGYNEDSEWITNDVPQARSLLKGRRAHFVPYVSPRDLRGAIRAARIASKVAADAKPEQVVSTGAAIAGIALPVLALRGYRATFVESVARRSTRSLTGRIARAAPRVRTLTQYPESARGKWECDGTILGNWSATEFDGGEAASRPGTPMRIFVVLGTIRPYRFDKAVDALLSILRPGDEVVWQVGVTDREGLPGRVSSVMSNEEVKKWMKWSDVVVTHAGVGSIIDAFEMGRWPVVVVRRRSRGEHVDDHQLDIASEIQRRRLGEVLRVDRPDRALLEKARLMRVSTGS